jgi:hypothetical protein
MLPQDHLGPGKSRGFSPPTAGQYRPTPRLWEELLNVVSSVVPDMRQQIRELEQVAQSRRDSWGSFGSGLEKDLTDAGICDSGLAQVPTVNRFVDTLRCRPGNHFHRARNSHSAFATGLPDSTISVAVACAARLRAFRVREDVATKKQSSRYRYQTAVRCGEPVSLRVASEAIRRPSSSERNLGSSLVLVMPLPNPIYEARPTPHQRHRNGNSR